VTVVQRACEETVLENTADWAGRNQRSGCSHLSAKIPLFVAKNIFDLSLKWNVALVEKISSSWEAKHISDLSLELNMAFEVSVALAEV